MNPQLARQAIHAANVTLARLSLAAGAAVPQHQHENEQITMVTKGKLRFHIAGQVLEVSAGEMLEIAPHEPHGVKALEDSEALDLFAPRREDWIRGDDAYLRR